MNEWELAIRPQNDFGSGVTELPRIHEERNIRRRGVRIIKPVKSWVSSIFELSPFWTIPKPAKVWERKTSILKVCFLNPGTKKKFFSGSPPFIRPWISYPFPFITYLPRNWAKQCSTQLHLSLNCKCRGQGLSHWGLVKIRCNNWWQEHSSCSVTQEKSLRAASLNTPETLYSPAASEIAQLLIDSSHVIVACHTMVRGWKSLLRHISLFVSCPIK